MPETTSIADSRFGADLAGIDALDVPVAPAPSRAAKVWSQLWPKLTAIGLAIGIWELVVLSGWKPEYVLPGPASVLSRLWHDTASGTIVRATAVTLRRAAVGYFLAVVIGSAVGLAVARSRVLRAALGSMITGLQTMPTITWFPLAIVLFGLSERAITFVVVLGAAPAIANGIISGVDAIPPLLLRAGRVLGARGVSAYRHVILPAAFPGFVAGLKQGWAFAWRSLMAGELLVVIAHRASLGQLLDFNQTNADYPGLLATMIAILVIGIVIDTMLFGRLEGIIRRRWGLVE